MTGIYGGKSAATSTLQPRDRRAPARGDCKTSWSPTPLTGPARTSGRHVIRHRGIQPGAGRGRATRNRHRRDRDPRHNQSGAYERAILSLIPQSVSQPALAAFVPLIEEGWLEVKTRSHRQAISGPAGAGWNRYPGLGFALSAASRAIGRYLGDAVELVDSAQNCGPR
jgi:hypothetical protein